jgi:prolipoprotein diacylglyceryl transferase
MNRVAFTIFGIEIMWYAIMIATGTLIGILLALREAKRVGLNEDALIDVLLAVMIVGIISARLYYVVFSPEEFNSFFEVINIRTGGMAIHGGVIGGLIAAIITCKIKKMDFWRVVDVLVPSVIIAQAIGRWGNFFNQEVYGGPTTLPWGIAISNLPGKYHPLFLYESLANLIIFGFLIWYRKNKKKSDGELLALYAILYGIVRFFLEAMRQEEFVLKFMGLSIAQIVSTLMVLLGVAIYFMRRKKQQ